MNKPSIIKKSLALSMTIVLALAAVLPLVGSARAQENGAAPRRSVLPAPSPAPGPTDPTEMEAFLDELFGSHMEEYHIAGAAVSVVKDGELFFTKGYGYADLENNIRVDPEQTIFRVGSVTKLFTWTAVMQLAEQGKLDLDADINTYLDFRIPDAFPEPITLKHLMTHTSGLEVRHTDMLVTDADDLVPAREFLVSHMPARVRPPGDYAGYANINANLAGYIVARVSGQPYDQYIQQHILDPLGMAHSSVHAPVPPDLRAHLSVAYTYVDGAFQAEPGYMAQWAEVPGAGLSASATDLARFMIAHLQNGRYSDATIPEAHILEEATARQMHSTLYTPDPRLLGNAYGFFEFSDNGQRTIGHGGEAPPINSLLLLLPDQNLGVFVVYNSEGGGSLTNQHFGFQRAFFDHYYPASSAEPAQPTADFAERASRYEGGYRYSMNSYTTLEKILGLLSTVEISDPGDGTLLFATPYGDWRFVEVEPLYFRQVDGPFDLVFRENDRGRITHLFTGLTPMLAFEKLRWFETPGFNMALALGSALIFLSMLPVAFFRFVRKRRLTDDRNPSSRGARAAYRLILAICILNLLFLAGTILWGEPNIVPLFGVSLIYRIVLGLGVLSSVLTAGALVCTALAWKKGYWGFAGRAYYTLVTLAAIAFVWFLNNVNLLGWRF